MSADPEGCDHFREFVLLPCPNCGTPTDSLKQYRYVNWCLFIVLGHVTQSVTYRGCPACMRRFLWKRCLVNLVPANVVWLILLFPWCVILTIASYQRGHSRVVLKGLTPGMAVERETERGKDLLRWAVTILSLVFFWFPILGLVGALTAWFLNRRATDWGLIASWIATAGAVVAQIAHFVFGVGKSW